VDQLQLGISQALHDLDKIRRVLNYGGMLICGLIVALELLGALSEQWGGYAFVLLFSISQAICFGIALATRKIGKQL
jgi:hypothetical protein